MTLPAPSPLQLITPPPTPCWAGLLWFMVWFGRVRAEEINVLMKATHLRAVNEATFFVQPAVQSCTVFATYHLLGNELTAPKVFLHAFPNSRVSFKLHKASGSLFRSVLVGQNVGPDLIGHSHNNPRHPPEQDKQISSKAGPGLCGTQKNAHEWFETKCTKQGLRSFIARFWTTDHTGWVRWC